MQWDQGIQEIWEFLRGERSGIGKFGNSWEQGIQEIWEFRKFGNFYRRERSGIRKFGNFYREERSGIRKFGNFYRGERSGIRKFGNSGNLGIPERGMQWDQEIWQFLGAGNSGNLGISIERNAVGSGNLGIPGSKEFRKFGNSGNLGIPERGTQWDQEIWEFLGAGNSGNLGISIERNAVGSGNLGISIERNAFQGPGPLGTLGLDFLPLGSRNCLPLLEQGPANPKFPGISGNSWGFLLFVPLSHPNPRRPGDPTGSSAPLVDFGVRFQPGKAEFSPRTKLGWVFHNIGNFRPVLGPNPSVLAELKAPPDERNAIFKPFPPGY
ncbi:uncharacterized protein LOC132083983 [Ammospiza nelsoni]|uniref:uncharacterized protein LOC132083983 n=1 Tax=Ammospiza nelsoni TaxID=2857394 RepID=UPI00286CFF37|nr:uncharacterized protein LOC132083983 [Ammospiza nelsoni]XP_059344948.1 uncharacterized protein LOC132083983 [Ammospiza nelsoni]XP_059344949.1 uncharacterized protein LOC132083983 [Ammospiza nelsoni]XP_059344950.1 uncharacterized protein LOC132083983 [Ammospiza nelsoni]XP_059344951.1 uncharacterized protein LOC132083983 [Ammospiza nelsoni]XP_059344952.1 uncharacterized protein LOC132083983 [Ammospiza nelsoni]XP_059344953.1 uncharacterized protein LOC132083983 [Ammospiza nelsoni]